MGEDIRQWQIVVCPIDSTKRCGGRQSRGRGDILYDERTIPWRPIHQHIDDTCAWGGTRIMCRQHKPV